MKDLELLQQRLRACRKCPNVCGPAVHGPAMTGKVMLVGQAPGIHEGRLGRPFAYTAGKTLFKWFKESLGIGEEQVRELIYFTAVARCFPGKGKDGKGDRPPSKSEIENCSEYLKAEIALVKPDVILAVGKIAIAEVLKGEGVTTTTPLENVVGAVFETRFHGRHVLVIPLPHPSGVSRWPHTEPGKSKLQAALQILASTVSPLLGAKLLPS